MELDITPIRCAHRSCFLKRPTCVVCQLRTRMVKDPDASGKHSSFQIITECEMFPQEKAGFRNQDDLAKHDPRYRNPAATSFESPQELRRP